MYRHQLKIIEGQQKRFPNVYSNLAQTIGNTPLIHLRNLSRNLYADILIKADFFNPLNTVKDRPCLYMLEEAERTGKLKPGMRIIEASRGSTGYALASLAKQRGYDITIVIPNTMNEQQLAWFIMLGADIVLTPGEHGVFGSVAKAYSLAQQDPNSCLLKQFENDWNWKAHYLSTGPEIWRDTGGNIDMFIAGLGTGGTFCGTAQFLKDKKPDVECIAVEPKEAPAVAGKPCSKHGLTGIGPGFVSNIMDKSLVSKLTQISTDKAYETVRQVIESDGVPIGLSSGATVAQAIKEASKQKNLNKVIVTMATSFTERYMASDFANPEIEKTEKLKETPITEKELQAARLRFGVMN